MNWVVIDASFAAVLVLLSLLGVILSVRGQRSALRPAMLGLVIAACMASASAMNWAIAVH